MINACRHRKFYNSKYYCWMVAKFDGLQKPCITTANYSYVATCYTVYDYEEYNIIYFFPTKAIHQRILLYNNLVIARAITKLLYSKVQGV